MPAKPQAEIVFSIRRKAKRYVIKETRRRNAAKIRQKRVSILTPRRETASANLNICSGNRKIFKQKKDTPPLRYGYITVRSKLYVPSYLREDVSNNLYIYFFILYIYISYILFLLLNVVKSRSFE
jgi:hypothetical protein